MSLQHLPVQTRTSVIASFLSAHTYRCEALVSQSYPAVPLTRMGSFEYALNTKQAAFDPARGAGVSVQRQPRAPRFGNLKGLSLFFSTNNLDLGLANPRIRVLPMLRLVMFSLCLLSAWASGRHQAVLLR